MIWLRAGYDDYDLNILLISSLIALLLVVRAHGEISSVGLSGSQIASPGHVA